MTSIPKKLPPKIAANFLVQGNTLLKDVKSDPKDKITVEIGDSKQADFKPQAKIMRWENEVNFSLRALEHPNSVVEVVDNVIKYKTPDYEVHQYELDPGDVGEDGGLEFEWVLPSKPPTNVLTATIQTKGLVFYYQPELSLEEIEEGVERPDNVVGSYAAYHQSRGGINRLSGMEYRSGKAFHIYRPKAVDSVGNEKWCSLHIDSQKNELSVTIPNEFLENAVYPIVVDPTFGYSTVGASYTFSGSPRGTKFTAPENGEIVSITNYAYVGGSTALGAALYSDSSGTATSLLAEDSGNESVTTVGWYTMNVSYSMTGSTAYWLCRWLNNAAGRYYYDTGDTDQLDFCSGATFETWPTTWSSGGKLARKMSIYATYTTKTYSSTTFSDTFDRSNSTSLGADWTEDVGDLQISSNILSNATSGSITSVLASATGGAPSSADYAVEADCLAITPGTGSQYSSIGVVGRMTSTTVFYHFRLNFNGDLAQLYLFNGSASLLAQSSYSISEDTYYTLKMFMEGSTIVCSVDGSVVLVVNDSTLTSAGYGGVRVYLDNSASASYITTNYVKWNDFSIYEEGGGGGSVVKDIISFGIIPFERS